jgi:uncharacterized protein
MSPPLPDLLDPWRAVDSRSVFAGRLPLSSLPRLCALLSDPTSNVAFRLAFFRAEDRRAVLRCEVTATLALRCQRCLGALNYLVNTVGLLALVSGIDEQRRLPDRYEPLLVGHAPIRPRDVIEDELLLALPQIPMHAPHICSTGMQKRASASAEAPGAGPFAVLAEPCSKE